MVADVMVSGQWTSHSECCLHGEDRYRLPVVVKSQAGYDEKKA